jgi:hypothetical protein
MPIRPENRLRYPPNWREIRARILERAGDKCEGSPAYPNCRAPNGWYRVKKTGQLFAQAREDDTVTRIVLTIGHLDHTPENCAAENLRAWCQRCHLNYDATHHAQTAYRTRRVGKAAGDLVE